MNGDKTDEPACLKKHLEELLQLYPALPILTGDAVYRQRPLLEVIYQYHRDYIFQVKANNKKTPEQFPLIFSGVKQREPDDKLISKKRGVQRYTFRNL
ncbi:MAG: hypothetical protein LBH00_06445, partial [Planctomycetaceae bacterium]|nr:hypothetical protein [Planctomycetaceae bacterium]